MVQFTHRLNRIQSPPPKKVITVVKLKTEFTQQNQDSSPLAKKPQEIVSKEFILGFGTTIVVGSEILDD